MKVKNEQKMTWNSPYHYLPSLPWHYFYPTIYITFSIASGGGHTPKIQTTRFKIRPVFFMEAWARSNSIVSCSNTDQRVAQISDRSVHIILHTILLMSVQINVFGCVLMSSCIRVGTKICIYVSVHLCISVFVICECVYMSERVVSFSGKERECVGFCFQISNSVKLLHKTFYPCDFSNQHSATLEVIIHNENWIHVPHQHCMVLYGAYHWVCYSRSHCPIYQPQYLFQNGWHQFSS